MHSAVFLFIGCLIAKHIHLTRLLKPVPSVPSVSATLVSRDHGDHHRNRPVGSGKFSGVLFSFSDDNSPQMLFGVSAAGHSL